MKKIIIAGPGNSGSGAILDFLKDRDDVFLPFENQEFRLVNDPDGIRDLEHNLYYNFSINGASNSMYAFKKFCKHLESKKKNRYPSKFHHLCQEYLKNITHLEYNGLPNFSKSKINLIDTFRFYFEKIILNKKISDIDVFKLILPVNHNLFINYSTNFIDKIIKSTDTYSNDKLALIDQSVNIYEAAQNLKFFSNSKCIITLRDPIGTYYSISQNPAFAYAGLTIDKFIRWYEYIYEKISNLEINSNKFLIIKFDDFLCKHNQTKKTILKFLSLDEKYSSFDIEKSIQKNSNIDSKLSSNDLHQLKTKLSKFIQK